MASEELAAVTKITHRSQVLQVTRFLSQPPTSRRASKLPAVQAPQKMLLSEQNLSGDFGAELFPLISVSSVMVSVSVLDLSFNDLEDNFWEHWTPELQQSVRLALTTLNLANNQFSARGLEAISSFVGCCPSLEYLDISLNPLVANIGEIASMAPFIRALDAPGHSRFRVLDLSCAGLTDLHISELLGADFIKNVAKLYLRSNELSDESAFGLANILQVSKIEVLSLAGNTIGNTGAASLAFVLDQAPALQILDLEENQIDLAGLASFFHAINGMVAPFSLRYLHLGRNPGSTENLLDQMRVRLQEKIIETQLNAKEQTTELNLCGSKIKRDILLECCLTDRYVHVVTRTLRASPRWSKLETLDLSGNEIGEKGVFEIGLFLALRPPLRVLNLSSNSITDQAIVGLADGLESNATLHELLLDRNHITDAGAKLLYLQAFKANQQRRIRLSVGNPLTSECKTMLAAISQAHDLRKRFAREFAAQEKLDFSGKMLRQYGATAIVEELVATPMAKCRSLDLSRNGLGDEGAQSVALLLRSYSQLEELDISFNDIGEEGACTVAEALGDNATLVSFSLHSVVEASQSKPKLQERGLCRLAQAIRKHKTLTKVDLRDNVTTPTVVRAFVEMLHLNPNIQKFNGSASAVYLARYDA